MSAKVPSRWASYDGGSAGTTSTSSPPWRGVSWAAADTVTSAISGNATANRIRRIRRLLSAPALRGLLRHPHRVELVVQVVARRDRPSLDPRAMGHDPMPLERVHRVHFLVQETLLELPDVLLPLLGIDRPTLLHVQLVEDGVLLPGVVGVADAPGSGRRGPALELVQVEVGLDHVAALGVHGDLEVPTAQIGEPLGRLGDLLPHAEADLPPLVDEPDPERLVRHGDPAILEREREALRDPGFLQEPPRLRPRLVDVGPVRGQLLQLGRRSRQRPPRYLAARHRLHDRDLRKRLRALIAVKREREGTAAPLVVERLLLVVHGGEQDAIPGALLHRDPGAQGGDETVAFRRREAAELNVGALAPDRRDLGRGVPDEERPVSVQIGL